MRGYGQYSFVNHNRTPKGYYAGSCYVGFLPDNRKMVFPTEAEYLEYFREVCAA